MFKKHLKLDSKKELRNIQAEVREFVSYKEDMYMQIN